MCNIFRTVSNLIVSSISLWCPNVQVGLQHGGNEAGKGPSWEVDLEHTITSCDGQDSIDIKATLTGMSLTGQVRSATTPLIGILNALG
jgi:hypothetical protein